MGPLSRAQSQTEPDGDELPAEDLTRIGADAVRERARGRQRLRRERLLNAELSAQSLGFYFQREVSGLVQPVMHNT